ncbi:MAG: TolB family protein, partial [Ktedonobacterales bacterium]
MAETVRRAGTATPFENDQVFTYAGVLRHFLFLMFSWESRSRYTRRSSDWRRCAARWGALAPLLLAVLLAACGPSATAHPNLFTTPTPSPRSADLTYIGADGNIWQLSLPEGSAVQLTSDARPHAITYSGLTWSPDGKLLATVRVTYSSQNSATQLVVLRADGQIVMQAPLFAVPYSHAFVWSPDSRYIAYRLLEARTSSSQALLVVLDTHSGALHKALTYPFQQGCAATHTALSANINAIHQTDGGIDTFGWVPDGRAVLASAGCSNDSSLRIDISSGSVTTGYPRGTTFQPIGNLLLGVWNAGGSAPVLGLRDDANGFVRDLILETAPSSAHFSILAGQAIWSATGSQVYYEYADG